MSKEHKTDHRKVRVIGRWLGILLFISVIASVGIWFVFATVSAWKVQTSSQISCNFMLNSNVPFSYIQYNIKDQAVEPYFRGSIFMNLGEISEIQAGPPEVDVITTGGNGYGDTTTIAGFFRDEPNKQYWMHKESEEVPLVRTEGSHRDFPFDSATVELLNSTRHSNQH